MIKTFDIAPYADTAIQVVQDVFKTMLYSDVRESSAEDYNKRSTEVTAAIFFNGDWRGATYIECSEKQALRFTQQLMDVPYPTEIDSDVGDAMGELVNMVGGNLKSALPRGVSLASLCLQGQGPQLPRLQSERKFPDRIRGRVRHLLDHDLHLREVRPRP